MSRKDFRYEPDLDRLLGEPEPAPPPDLVASVMAAVDRAAAADRRVDELLRTEPVPEPAPSLVADVMAAVAPAAEPAPARVVARRVRAAAAAAVAAAVLLSASLAQAYQDRLTAVGGRLMERAPTRADLVRWVPRADDLDSLAGAAVPPEPIRRALPVKAPERVFVDFGGAPAILAGGLALLLLAANVPLVLLLRRRS